MLVGNFRTNATISMSKICVIDLSLILPTFHSHFLFTPFAIWGWKWQISPPVKRMRIVLQVIETKCYDTQFYNFSYRSQFHFTQFSFTFFINAILNLGLKMTNIPARYEDENILVGSFRTNATISRSKICVMDLRLILPTFHSQFLFTPFWIWGIKWKISPPGKRMKMFF